MWAKRLASKSMDPQLGMYEGAIEISTQNVPGQDGTLANDYVMCGRSLADVPFVWEFGDDAKVCVACVAEG